MPSQLDLTAVLTADSRVWVKETQRAAQSFNNLAKTVQTQSTKTQNRLAKLAKFAKGTLAVAIGFSLSRQIMQTAASLKRLGKEAVFGAARVEQMTAVLNMLGQGLGYSTREMAGFTEEIRKSGIEMGIAQNTLQEFIRYEMDLTQSTKLAQVAQDAAVMSNSNSSETLQRLIYGISRQNSLILRNAGIQVMAGAAIDKHAASLNKSADQLTSNERTQAVLNAVLQEGTKIQGAYTRSLEEPIKKLGSLQRIWDDIAGQIGDTLYPAFKVFINDIWDPYVKWLKKITAEGTRVNNFLSDFGNMAAGAFTHIAEFAETDAFTEMGRNLVQIADSFLEIFKSMRPLTNALVNMQTFGAAVKVVSVWLEYLSQLAKVLAPLLQALFTLKMVKLVMAHSSALIIDLRLRAMLFADTIRQAIAQSAATASTVGATLAVRGLTVAMAGLRAAFMAFWPLIAAFVAFKTVTTIIGAFQERQTEAEEATERLNDALYDQGVLVDDAERAFKNYLNTTSRFADRNQIDDLDELATVVGLTRTNLVQLLDMPNMGGLDQFIAKMLQLGGENGLVEAVNQEIQVGTRTLTKEDAGFRLAAQRRDLILSANLAILEGNTDLIASFQAESQARQDAAKSNIEWMLREGDQTALWMQETLQTISPIGDAIEMLHSQMGTVAMPTELVDSAVAALGGDFLELALQLAEGVAELEEEFLDAEEAAKEAADQIEEYGQKAKKLSGILADLTDEQELHWMEVVKANEAYKGTIERLDETGERLDIFSKNLTNAMDATTAQEEVLNALSDIFEALTDETMNQEKATKALAGVIRTQGVAAARKYMEAQINIADAAGEASDADALFRQGLEMTTNMMVAAGEEAGLLQTQIGVLTDELYELDGFSANVQLVWSRNNAFNLAAIEAEISKISHLGPEMSGQWGDWLGVMQDLLRVSVERETDRLGRSLRTIDDLERMITGHITDQIDARQKGMRALIRYRRADQTVEDIEESINDLLDERNKLNLKGNRLMMEQELTIERQERAVIQLGQALRDIVERRDRIELEAGGLSVLKEERAALILQSQEVTGTEQELIDRLKVLTKKQAENGDITAIEAAEIENLHIEMRAAKRQMDAGIISQIQYQAAQQRVTEAVTEALLPSERLLELNSTIADLERAQATIKEDVKIAQLELAIATKDRNEELSKEIVATKAIEEIDRQLTEATFQLAEATMEVTAAEVELAKTGPEVVAALQLVREANQEVGAVGVLAFEEILRVLNNAVAGAQAAMPEFAFLKHLLEQIELAGLTAEQIDVFVTSVEDALEAAEGVLTGDPLIALIEALLPADWEVDLAGWRDDLQAVIDNWDLSALIQLAWSDMPEWAGTTESTVPDIPLPESPPSSFVDPRFMPSEGGSGYEPPAEWLINLMNQGEEYVTLWNDIDTAATTTLDNAADRFNALNEAASGVGAFKDSGAISAVDIETFLDQLDSPGWLAHLAGTPLPSAASGGIVKRDTLANVHAGEAIIPLKGGMGLGATYNINIGAGISDPTAVSEAVVEALRAYERGNGPVPVTTTASMYTASS